MPMIDEFTRQAFENHRATVKAVSLATASKDGVPNVVPVGMIWLAGDEVWVVDNYFNKTLANIKENPVAAVYFLGPDHSCLQLKGRAVYTTEGPDFEEAHAFAKKKGEQFPAKGLLKIVVSEVYDTAPGPNAGKPYEPKAGL